MNTFLTAGKPAALGIFARLQWRRENFWRLEIDLLMINKTLEEPNRPFFILKYFSRIHSPFFSSLVRTVCKEGTKGLLIVGVNLEVKMVFFSRRCRLWGLPFHVGSTVPGSNRGDLLRLDAADVELQSTAWKNQSDPITVTPPVALDFQ